MELLIAADLVPTESNEELFKKRDSDSLLGDKLNEIWSSSDLRIFNLEVPLTDKETPISKQGPNLMAPTSTIKGIKGLNPSLVTLANNHILDQGIQGLNSTQKLLNRYDIPFVGAGKNLKKATEPYILEKNGISIGVYACAENEFTIATNNSPGANPFDPLESLDHIEKLKTKCDYVVVLYHGGKEHYRYPSPYLQKVCRKIVLKGADLVVCQHSHCVGSFEQFEGSTIVYGQGNFIFNKYDNEFWNTGLLIKLNISSKVEIEYIPIVKSKVGVRLATGQVSEEILLEFNKRSEKILQDNFIEKKYQEFAQENIVSYLRNLAGFGKWMSRIDRKLFNGMLLKRKYNKEQLLAIQNYIECEAHRELMLEGLKRCKSRF